MTFHEILTRIAAGEHLTIEQMSTAIDACMKGEVADAQIAELLLGLRANGETVDEIAGAALAMRRHMTPIQSARTGLLDTCGTGGDASGTFNVSTAAALVTAACGVPVAKHGNRSITSKTGSADVLAALGVRIDAPVLVVERCLDEVGICFCFAPLLHPAMKHVAAVRRQLGVPTIFNLLGPLCNPASAPYQLLGVGRREIHDKIAAALRRLGGRLGVVVSGDDGLDEVTLATQTRVLIVSSAEERVEQWSPEDFGLQRTADLSLARVDGPEASAALITRVLAGDHGVPRDLVVLNAAAALWTAGQSPSLSECASLASAAIDSGAAQRLLDRFVALSHSH
ncbi:MAG: anthranilate phosphoribosyltransferase [Pirellulales bacterium]